MSNASATIYVGISQCLLGDKVRFDGGHKHSKFCTEALGQYFTYIPVCPEMGIGLGTPRQPIHLVDNPENPERPRARGVKDASLDVTEPLEQYAATKAAELTNLSGYIFMGKSPSCGLERIKIYHENGNPLSAGQGIFAREFTRLHPLLPVEEENRLNDARLRENFVERVFAYHRWQQLVAGGLTTRKLQDFHADHKYTLMAHRQESYRYLGRIVANAHLRPMAQVAADYIQHFMATMKVVTSNRSHANVLMHILGYLKKDLAPAAKQEMLNLIDLYRQGDIPLIAPLTLLNHHFSNHPNSYISRQTYLQPHPADLKLRNFY